MKQLNRYALQSAILLSLFISSCTEDVEELEQIVQDKKEEQALYSITKIQIDDIEDAQFIKETITATQKRVSSSLDGKSKSQEHFLDDLVIDLDNPTEIINGEYRSYTFSAALPEMTGVLNVFLSLQYDGSYRSYLVHYDVTDQEKEVLLVDPDGVNLEGRITFLDLENWVPENSTRRNPYQDALNNCPNGSCCSVSLSAGIDCNCFTTTVSIAACDSSTGGGSSSGTPGDNTGDNGYDGDGAPGSGAGGGGSGSSSGGDTTPANNDPNCIADIDGNCIGDTTTIVLIPIDPTPTPEELEDCEKLAQLTATGPNDANIKPLADELRTKTSADREWNVTFQRTITFGEFRTYTDDDGIQESPFEFESETFTGTRFIGSIHSHPRTSYEMFSWIDLRTLRNTYRDVHEDFRDGVFLMMVADNGAVYAVQVTDFDALSARIDADFADAQIQNSIKPELYLEEVFKELFSTSGGDLEHAFLHEYEEAGFSLSKASDDTLTNWNTLTLDNAGDVEENPCE